MGQLFEYVMKRARTRAAGAAFAVLLVMQAGSANATLIGDVVGCSETSSGSCNPTAAFVGAGVEFQILSDLVAVDVGASQVTLSNLFNGSLTINAAGTVLTLFDLDWIGDPGAFVSGFAINTNSGVLGLTAADLSFTADSVSVNLTNTTFFQSASATFDIITAHPVPEPATVALFGLSLVGIAGAARGRRKTA